MIQSQRLPGYICGVYHKSCVREAENVVFKIWFAGLNNMYVVVVVIIIVVVGSNGNKRKELTQNLNIFFSPFEQEKSVQSSIIQVSLVFLCLDVFPMPMSHVYYVHARAHGLMVMLLAHQFAAMVFWEGVGEMRSTETHLLYRQSTHRSSLQEQE
jgi:hypothetical protein